MTQTPMCKACTSAVQWEILIILGQSSFLVQQPQQLSSFIALASPVSVNLYQCVLEFFASNMLNPLLQNNPIYTGHIFEIL